MAVHPPAAAQVAVFFLLFDQPIECFGNRLLMFPRHVVLDAPTVIAKQGETGACRVVIAVPAEVRRFQEATSASVTGG